MAGEALLRSSAATDICGATPVLMDGSPLRRSSAAIAVTIHGSVRTGAGMPVVEPLAAVLVGVDDDPEIAGDSTPPSFLGGRYGALIAPPGNSGVWFMD